MKSESLWQDSDEVYWLPALSLPTLLWARPFLPMMGLPRALVEQPEVWEPLYAKAVVEHETRLQMQNWAHRMQGERGELLRQVITKALFDLAAQLGQEVAIDLERWVRRHFLCNEVTSALSAWRLVLRTACYPPNSRCNQIPPPAVLVPILPQITNLVSFERINEIYVTVERVAPPLLDEQVPHETMEHCFEATLVSQAATQALTIKALQTIASKLNDQERKEVVKWALVQEATLIYSRDQQKLCRDKYLRIEPPCFDVPSVFDLPSPDDTKSG